MWHFANTFHQINPKELDTLRCHQNFEIYALLQVETSCKLNSLIVVLVFFSLLKDLLNQISYLSQFEKGKIFISTTSPHRRWVTVPLRSRTFFVSEKLSTFLFLLLFQNPNIPKSKWLILFVTRGPEMKANSAGSASAFSFSYPESMKKRIFHLTIHEWWSTCSC